MALSTFTLLCNSHHHPSPEFFTFLNWNSVPIKHWLPTPPPHLLPPPGPRHLPMYFLTLWIWLFYVPHISGIKQYLSVPTVYWNAFFFFFFFRGDFSLLGTLFIYLFFNAILSCLHSFYVCMYVCMYVWLCWGAWFLQLHFFPLKIALVIQGLLCFHTNCKNFCSNSGKNTIGSLTGIALNL